MAPNKYLLFSADSCYKIVFQKVNWTTARTMCKSVGPTSDLVTIHSSKESDFVTGKMRLSSQQKELY